MKKQNDKEALICSKRGCHELQNGDNEFCDKHSPIKILKCPHCSERLTYVRMEIKKSLYGDLDLTRMIFDEDDMFGQDIESESYFCPNCEKPISNKIMDNY